MIEGGSEAEIAKVVGSLAKTQELALPTMNGMIIPLVVRTNTKHNGPNFIIRVHSLEPLAIAVRVTGDLQVCDRIDS
jgi:hypothetical protein